MEPYTELILRTGFWKGRPTTDHMFILQQITEELPEYNVKLHGVFNIKNRSVAYSSQGSHTGQLEFCNWLADGCMTG